MLASKTLKEGPGDPLVFLHGFLGKGEDWEAVCSYLNDCRCIAFDLPGHGNSPFTTEICIDLPKFHLIGYSMGGRLAATYAAKHPEKILSLTLLSAHPGLTSAEKRTERLQSDQKWAKLLDELSIDDFLKHWYDQSIFKSFKPNLEMRKKQNISGLKSALLHYSLAYQPYMPLDHVLVGEWDEKFKALFAHPVIIPQAAHMVHLENPKAVAAIIQNRIAL